MTRFNDIHRIGWFLIGVICSGFLTLGYSQEKEDAPKGEAKKDAPEPAKPEPEPEPVIKQAEATIGGKKVSYEVTAGTITLPDKKEKGKERARVFYISYVVDKGENAPDRPIAFCFNGGPGSSSVWLHLGALGPRRVVLDEEGLGTTLSPPPYGLVDNEHSVLDLMDLVFIDPVSTGFSRPEDPEKAGQFHGLEGDIESVGQFIHQYCSKNGRWDSPKYLIGESYGGIRAAGLADHLQDRYGMYLNGVVLVSALLDFSTLRFSDSNDLPYMLFMPSYAATAKYHGKVEGESPEAVYEEALKVMKGPYADALLAGHSLDEADRTAVIEQLANLTGIAPDDIDRANLRLDSSFFRKMLMREEGKSVGRFDARVLGIDADKASSYPEYDASYAVVYGPFAGAMNAYLREEIGFESEEVYEILTSDVHPWSYDPFSNRYVSMGQRLSSAMTTNPHLKVFVAAGYYDLATPPAAIEYSIDHLPIDPELRKNFEVFYYEGGHMMYSHLGSLEKLKKDLTTFVK